MLCLLGTARAQVAGRLIDAVDANERGNHVDISIIFGCGLQYISHTPASEGDTLRLRFAPLPDCGSLVGTLSSPPLEGVTAIRSIEAEQLVLNQVDVTVHFAAAERYVLAPTADSHGVRIRLLRPESSGTRVMIFEHADESAYLQLFPKFVIRRTTLGARWQFARSHALTLEVSDSHSRTQSYNEFRLQWSAALL